MAGNVQRVYDSFESWNEGGLRALSDGWWADDIIWHDLPELPDPVSTQGRAPVEQRVEEMVAVIGHFRFNVKDVQEHGDLMLSELELVGAGTQSGAGFAGNIHQLVRWRDGRIKEVWSYSSREDALAQLSSAR